jgi:hypothetical protein
VFLQDFADGHELGIAETDLGVGVAQDGNAARFFQGIPSIAGFDDKTLAVSLGVIRFTIENLGEPKFNETTNVGIFDEMQ